MKRKNKKTCNRFDYGGLISQQITDLYKQNMGGGLADTINLGLNDSTIKESLNMLKSAYNFNPVASNNDELLDIFDTNKGVGKILDPLYGGQLKEKKDPITGEVYYTNSSKKDWGNLLKNVLHETQVGSSVGGSFGGPIGSAWGTLAGLVTGVASAGLQADSASSDISTINLNAAEMNRRQSAANANAANNLATRQKLGFESGYFRDGGDITYFNNGGTHEQNPFGGIPQGIAPNNHINVVEEGEVKWESPNGDYIFSNNQRLNKQDIVDNLLPNNLTNKTIAEAAKKVLKESDERPYDYISNNGKEHYLDILRDINEAKRPKNNEVNSFENGGNTNDKKKINPKLYDVSSFGDYHVIPQWAKNIGKKQNAAELNDASKALINSRFIKSDTSPDPSLNSDWEFINDFNNALYTAKPSTQSIIDSAASVANTVARSNSSQQNKNVASDNNTQPTKENESAGNNISAIDPKIRAKMDEMLGLPGIDWDGKFNENKEKFADKAYSSISKSNENTSTSTIEKSPYKYKGKSPKQSGFDANKIGNVFSNIGDVVSALAPAIAAAFDDPNYNFVNELRNSFRPVDTPYVSSANYMKYMPVDLDYILNQINRQSVANARNIMNLSGGNRATAMAGLFGNDLNTQTARGNATLQAALQNMQNYQNVQKHNTGINEFDINQYTTNARFNAQGLAQARQAAAMLGQQEFDAWKDREYANFSQALNNLQGIKKDRWTNDQIQMLVDSGAIAWDPRTGQYIIKND